MYFAFHTGKTRADGTVLAKMLMVD
ncbi:MAG: hypothetical protein UZ06_CHB003001541, partial [Chlorobi bacterium OLB6]